MVQLLTAITAIQISLSNAQPIDKQTLAVTYLHSQPIIMPRLLRLHHQYPSQYRRRPAAAPWHHEIS